MRAHADGCTGVLRAKGGEHRFARARTAQGARCLYCLTPVSPFASGYAGEGGERERKRERGISIARILLQQHVHQSRLFFSSSPQSSPSVASEFRPTCCTRRSGSKHEKTGIFHAAHAPSLHLAPISGHPGVRANRSTIPINTNRLLWFFLPPALGPFRHHLVSH